MENDDLRLVPTPVAAAPIDTDLPQHIAVIMDGNGRWATRNGLPRVAGHRRGVDAVKALVENCARRKIPYLTLFAFSSENWKRPSAEVKLLLELLTSVLESEVRKLHENDVCLRIIGNLSRFSPRVRLLIRNAQELTRSNSSLNLTVAVNYGGRWDVTQACRQIAQQVAHGDIDPAAISKDTVARHMSTSELPEPDLFIRTGGERRISNFLLWQMAYTELYFTDTLWPDFTDDDLAKAIESFAHRQRRFGQTSEQVTAAHRAQNA
ncbi:MAG: isoprenyl transferase [Gammaproteobacteria bacterium]|nr:isoprenyl transferase [Gammaproteobacteria bacterium]MDH3468744.1 isoprenyl transferase [Gammaproteobacteria bacterium]